MDVSVEPAALAEKPIIARLLQLYHYDFTEFLPLKLDANGEYPYRYLDAYWDPAPGEQRYPLLIRVDGELAGFAFVRLVNEVHIMAEFFVMRPFRRRGTGMIAATAVFRRFPGRWIVHQVPANKPAQAFWHRLIDGYTGGQFEEERETDGALVQKFVSLRQS